MFLFTRTRVYREITRGYATLASLSTVKLCVCVWARGISLLNFRVSMLSSALATVTSLSCAALPQPLQTVIH